MFVLQPHVNIGFNHIISINKDLHILGMTGIIERKEMHLPNLVANIRELKWGLKVDKYHCNFSGTYFVTD